MKMGLFAALAIGYNPLHSKDTRNDAVANQQNCRADAGAAGVRQTS